MRINNRSDDGMDGLTAEPNVTGLHLVSACMTRWMSENKAWMEQFYGQMETRRNEKGVNERVNDLYRTLA